MSSERQNEDELDFDYADRVPKRGMSTGTKILLGFLIGGGVLGLICCLGGIYLAFNMFEVSKNPADVIATTNEITTIDIPQDQFPPQLSMKMNMFGFYKMTMVVYSNNNGQNSNYLFLASMELAEASAEELEQALNQASKDQGKGNDLRIDSNETREIEIQGAPREFTFSEATNNKTGDKFRQIKGAFPAKKGSAFIIIQVPEEEYDDEAMMQMLESIE
ncbi:MAG: hypothetical protein KDA65_14215 [Planctomycetaceae bacterium]|nr:hypothetical protein [Planctomycetaceae bacterium]